MVTRIHVCERRHGVSSHSLPNNNAAHPIWSSAFIWRSHVLVPWSCTTRLLRGTLHIRGHVIDISSQLERPVGTDAGYTYTFEYRSLCIMSSSRCQKWSLIWWGIHQFTKIENEENSSWVDGVTYKMIWHQIDVGSISSWPHVAHRHLCPINDCNNANLRWSMCARQASEQCREIKIWQMNTSCMLFARELAGKYIVRYALVGGKYSVL